ncbi:MAG: hypothetical protein ABIP74_01905 [Candidatus Saccharimonas sp.]
MFEPGENFGWQFPSHTITYDVHDPDAEELLLHEIGHALLGHRDYTYDIHLVEMERAAWDKAREIAPNFGVMISENDIEDSLDTYRDWLHARSTCPHCGSTGVQDGKLNFTCLACHYEWHANEARTCQLRRTSIKKRP